MSRTTLLDTGPLMALVDRGDRFHAWTRASLERLRTPLLSCQPVVTEACFLLRHLRGGPQAVLSLVERGVVRLDFDLEREVAPSRASWRATRTSPWLWPTPASFA